MKKIPAWLLYELILDNMGELRIYKDTDTKTKVISDYLSAFKIVFPDFWDEENLDLVVEKLLTNFREVHQQASKRNDVTFEGFKTIFIQRRDTMLFPINLN